MRFAPKTSCKCVIEKPSGPWVRARDCPKHGDAGMPRELRAVIRAARAFGRALR
jgi:hypothetical protein